MKSRELKPIFEYLTHRISDLAYHKSVLFIRPLNGLLRGVHLDPSGFSKELFSVDVFYMPLCVPTDYLTLTFGKRISAENGSWSMQEPDLSEMLLKKFASEALPFLSSAPTLREFSTVVRQYFGNPHGPKAAAYALARIGESKQAIAMIEDYLPRLDLSSHWQKEIDEESRALRHLLIYEPALAAAKLEEWESETIRNLGLERFR